MRPVMSVHELANALFLPVDWIKSQAAAGNLPHLKVGRRYLFNPPAVEAALGRMAAGGTAVAIPDRVEREAAHASA
jgi:excisionase family DNA binding protein